MKDRFATDRKSQPPEEGTVLLGMVVSFGCQASPVVFFLVLALIVQSPLVALIGFTLFGLFQWIAVFLLLRLLSAGNRSRLRRPVIYTSIAGTLVNVLMLITLGPDIFSGAAIGRVMLK